MNIASNIAWKLSNGLNIQNQTRLYTISLVSQKTEKNFGGSSM